jgi:hypothetical protein
VFSRTDTVTDSERFYNSVLEYFEDVDEQEEVAELLIWWNRYTSFALDHDNSELSTSLLCRQIFPGYSSARRLPTKDGARAIMKEKRALQKHAHVRSTPENT